MRRQCCFSLLLTLIGLLAASTGCHEGAGAKTAAEQVGIYPPPSVPVGNRPRIGITALAADGDPSATVSSATLGESSADELADLLAKTSRFEVIKREQFAVMLSQQGLSDLVRPGSVTRRAEVRGVDYILVGSVSNLSVTKTAEPVGWWDNVKDTVTRAKERSQVKITAECGVGFSLIEPATEDSFIPTNSSFKREAGATEFGFDVLPGSTDAVKPGTPLPVTREDRERIVRLALDDAIRKAIPKIDRFLAARPGAKLEPSAGSVAPSMVARPAIPSAGSATTARVEPATRPALPANNIAAKLACPNCGEENDSAAIFCKRCGAKLK